MHEAHDSLSAQLRGRDVLYVTLATALITGVGIAALLGLAGVMTDRPTGSHTMNLSVLFGSIIVLNGAIVAAVVVVLIQARRMTWRDLGFQRPSANWILGSIGLGVILVATIEGIERIFDIPAGQLTTWLIAPDGFSWFGLFGGIVLIGFLAPFGEELYFRGLIYRWLRDHWGPTAAIPLSALVFASAHFYYPIPHMLLVAFLGLILAISYERSGSVWVPIGVHAAQNTTVVILIYRTLA